ncbi:hypothetical protein KC359_g3039 [Hortaea werneckii]|nr:hypothetical protein KC359_g3039 [Hortaea werneckii]KAI7501967.1 hypothetical protein KC347_g9092 [Hortaea werneckii]
MSRALLPTASPRLHQHVKPLLSVATPLHPYTTTTTSTSQPPTASAPRTPPPVLLRPPQVLSYRYEPRPSPINCTTLPPTKDYLVDPSHPHHLKAKRRLQSFNPSILNWRVHCPVAASGKKVVRDWCSRRARTALQQTLQQQLRLDLDGSPRQGQREEGQGGKSSAAAAAAAGASEKAVPPPRQGLKGALLVILKAETALTASTEEVRRAVEWVLESVQREDRAREISDGGGKAGKRGEGRSVKGGGKGVRFAGGKEVQGA